MRKLLLIILLIFLVSTFVYSYNPGNADIAKPRIMDAQRLANLTTDKQVTAARALETARSQNILTFSELKNNSEFVKFSKYLDFRARTLKEINKEKAQQNFLQAKSNLILAQEKLEEKKQEFLALKERKKFCSEGECADIEQQLLGRAKQGLLNAADKILEHLRKTRARVEANEHLSDEEVNSLLERLDEKINEVEEVRQDIESATTKEEFRNAVRKLSAAWVNARFRARLALADSYYARFAGILVRAKYLENKVDRIAERMKEHGKDTTLIEPLIDELKAKLETTREQVGIAKEKFRESRETDDQDEKDSLINEGFEALKQAKAALKEANQKLREILKIIRDQAREEEQEIEAEEVEE